MSENAHCEERGKVTKWKLTDQHLIQKNSKRPPIYRLALRLTSDRFRRNIIRSSTKGLRLSSVLNVFLALFQNWQS